MVNDSTLSAVLEFQKQMQEFQKAFDVPAYWEFRRQMQEVQRTINDPSFQRALRNYRSAAQRVSAMSASYAELVEAQRTTARVASDLAPVIREFQQLIDPDVFARLEELPTSPSSPSVPDREYEAEAAEPAPLVPPELDESEDGWVAKEFLATLFLNIRYGHREYTGDVAHPGKAIELSTAELAWWGSWCTYYSFQVNDPTLQRVLWGTGFAFTGAALSQTGKAPRLPTKKSNSL